MSVECFENFIVLKRPGNKDVCISLLTLRLCCPCAFCSGETDALGNKFGGTHVVINEDITILNFIKIGHYGLRFFWSDGHSDGIYTHAFLDQLAQKND